MRHTLSQNGLEHTVLGCVATQTWDMSATFE